MRVARQIQIHSEAATVRRPILVPVELHNLKRLASSVVGNGLLRCGSSHPGPCSATYFSTKASTTILMRRVETIGKPFISCQFRMPTMTFQALSGRGHGLPRGFILSRIHGIAAACKKASLCCPVGSKPRCALESKRYGEASTYCHHFSHRFQFELSCFRDFSGK